MAVETVVKPKEEEKPKLTLEQAIAQIATLTASIENNKTEIAGLNKAISTKDEALKTLQQSSMTATELAEAKAKEATEALALKEADILRRETEFQAKEHASLINTKTAELQLDPATVKAMGINTVEGLEAFSNALKSTADTSTTEAIKTVEASNVGKPLETGTPIVETLTETEMLLEAFRSL